MEVEIKTTHSEETNSNRTQKKQKGKVNAKPGLTIKVDVE